jgi:hypothetical protein
MALHIATGDEPVFPAENFAHVRLCSDGSLEFRHRSRVADHARTGIRRMKNVADCSDLRRDTGELHERSKSSNARVSELRHG